MRIWIRNEQKKVKCSIQRIRDSMERMLRASGYPKGEVSILLVDDPGITTLNIQYLNRTGPTNVLAFPMKGQDDSDLRFLEEIHPDNLGDLVISLETAKREADDKGLELQQRVEHLLAHGLLHLLGYDHEGSEEEARQMEEKERELLSSLRGEPPD